MARILAALSLAAMALAGVDAFAGERTVTLAVDNNMYCEAWPCIVRQSLANVPGVETVAVSYERKTATVTDDDRETTPGALSAATAGAGYPSRAIP